MNSDIEEKVRARAHQIWEQEGRHEGQAEEHWRRAVEELEAAGQIGHKDAVEAAEAGPEQKPKRGRKAAAPSAESAPAEQPKRTRSKATAAKDEGEKKPAAKRAASKPAQDDAGGTPSASAGASRKRGSSKESAARLN